MVIDNPPLSHPSRGAWIEIGQHQDTARQPESHPSRGAWIEIVLSHKNSTRSASRTPHGVRGLKCQAIATPPLTKGVAPLTGCVD